MAESLRCRAMEPAPAHARRRPTPHKTVETATAAPLSALGNQAVQRALKGSEEDLEHKGGCGCGGASKGAPQHACGLASESGGGGGDVLEYEHTEEQAVEYVGEDKTEEAVGDYDIGYSTEEEYVGKLRPPMAGGAATIVCDGKGGYRAQLNSWAGQPCEISSAVLAHENSHAADWKGRYPKGCEGKSDGDKIPLGGDGYAAFLKTSECTAHTKDLERAAELLKKYEGKKDTDCVKKIKDYIKLTENQKKAFC